MNREKGFTPKEMILKAASQHELINKQTMIILTAVTNKLNKVVMTELAKEVDFGKPLTVSLETFLVKNLDGNRERLKAKAEIVINVALVDSAEAAFSEDVVGAEALGDGLELEESEGDDGRRSARVGSRGIAQI